MARDKAKRAAWRKAWAANKRATDPEWCERQRAAQRRASRKQKGAVNVPPEPAPGAPCPICNSVPRRALNADHDHSTGQFRGWLCNRCNQCLGFAQDDPERLEALAAYLRRHVNT